MSARLVMIAEGKTKLRVPKESLTAREPATNPVFFNPAARVNRDVSVAITSVLAGSSFCDVLAGTGARGIRIAKEVPRSVQVTLNDFNRFAMTVAKRNGELNRVTDRCSFSHDEANHFLYSRFGRDEKFDFLDLDPFGSPAPFLEAGLAASAHESVVSVTATDTAVLCGVYPSVAFRRYGSTSRRSEFEHETAIRILLYFCCRVAAAGDIGIEPIACHSTRHYLRVYLQTHRSAASADRSVKQVGYVAECRTCGECTASEAPLTKCRECGERVQAAGPIWTGRLTDGRIVERAKHFADRMSFTEAAAILQALVGVDRYPPYSYDLERICSRLKISSVSQQRVSERLSSEGFVSMKQPFEKSGLKTKASYAETAEIVKETSSSSPQTHQI